MLLDEIKEKIATNQSYRKALAKESFAYFFPIYFSHYLKYPTADFQREWCGLLVDQTIKFLELLGFRGSAKTTYAMLGYPIWEVISGRTNFIVLISDTFPQVKEHIYNIKAELDSNELLIKDFGVFDAIEEAGKKEEWQKTSLVIPRYGAKILAKSRGQKVRGTRFRQWRPQVVIIDDPEDIDTVRSKEGRDQTYKWLNGEVIPAGSEETKYLLTGNLLHSDGLMNRIKKEIEGGVRRGVVREYPFFGEDGLPLWKEKFSTSEMIAAEKGKVDFRTWAREYELKIVPEEGQVVKDEWIKKYKTIPNDLVIQQATGVDLAISKKDTADYTAMVSGKLATVEGNPKIYIMPNPTNERLSGFETTTEAKKVSLALGNGSLTQLWVEDVAYQKMQIEAMENAGLPVEGVNVSTDKRARLQTIAGYIQNGTVEFPETGCEDLIIQLTGFGIEAYDDLVDAFIILVQGLMNQYADRPSFAWV